MRRRKLLAGLGASMLVPATAKAVSSPYNFSTFASTSQFKIFGGHIIEVPVACSGPNTDYSYNYIIQNAFSGPNLYANWVLPQIKRWKQNGGNHIRHHADASCVLSGAMTQAAYEAYFTTVANDCRALVMTFSTNLFVGPTYASATGGPYTNNQWWSVMSSLITNVLEPNRDVVAYFEPGMNETTTVDNAGIPITLDMCARARLLTTIPLSISGAQQTDISWMDPADIDLVTLHCYVANSFQTIGQFHWDSMKNSQHRVFLPEENGIKAVSYAAKATYFNSMLRQTFGHPNIVGFVTFAGYGPNPSGDFTTYNPESCPTNALIPTRIWADQPPSITMAAWGQPNRKVSWDLTQTGSPSITSTLANLPLTWVTHDVTTPTESGAAPNSVIWNASLPISLTGSISFTGDPGSTYRISLRINDINSVFYVIGTPLDITGSASGSAINISGPLPTPWPVTNLSGGLPSGALSFWISVQRIAGAVDATGVSLTANITFGVAPALNAPIATPQPGLL